MTFNANLSCPVSFELVDHNASRATTLFTIGTLAAFAATGSAALAVPLAIQAARTLYVGLFGGQSGLPGVGGLSTALFYGICSFLILMVPTAMMGATLPLLARQAVRREE